MQNSDRKTQNSKRRLPKKPRKTLKSYKKRGWNIEKIYSPESKTLKSYKKRSWNIEKTYSTKYLHRKKVIIGGAFVLSLIVAVAIVVFVTLNDDQSKSR